ncbi:hypothetical protein C8R45DRAFT_256640 [Mycena sanguinolenta]|nr:hypothetical protein C8R45DRAFT_256640 [Mycena sanguinolenta]
MAEMPVHKCIYIPRGRCEDSSTNFPSTTNPMVPSKNSQESQGRGFHDRCEKSGILEAQERDLPPLPDEKMLQLCPDQDAPAPFTKSTLKSSPSPSLATPSTHDLVFPVVAHRPPRASSLRPKLHLDTEWAAWAAPPRPPYFREIHSAGDVTGRRSRSTSNASLSTACSSWKGSISTTSGASSQEHLLPYCSSPDHDSETENLAHHGTSLPYVTLTKPASSPSRSKDAKKPSGCRFLNAVRPKLPVAAKLSTLVHTRRAVAANSSVIDNMVAKPFIDSDPHNPLLGITVTVSQQRLVSKPMIMPLPDLEVFPKTALPVAKTLRSAPSASSLRSPAFKSASAVSLVDLNLDKPLPTPTPSPPPTPASTDDEQAAMHVRLPCGDNHKGGGDLMDMDSDPIDDHDDQLPGTAEVEEVPIALDLDPFAGVPSTGPQYDPDPDSDPPLDSDHESEPEVVEFRSRLSVRLTPATAMRMHLPKRRKRYTTHAQTV